MKKKIITVGIYGASGYMGGEALRILSEHPSVKVVWVTSRSSNPIEYIHRNFEGLGISFINPQSITPCDVVFIAAPTGVAMSIAEKLLNAGTKIIDLGSDFRLKNRGDWERIYKKRHVSWNIAQEAVYGIPELHRREIKKARVIANPGCYSSAVIFGLAPLVKTGIIDGEKMVVDGLSGTAGAGCELDIALHHPEMSNNLVSYNVVDHRHTYEIEQELGLLTHGKVTVHLSTTYVPISRGILAICHCFPKKKILRSQLLELYKEFYTNENFIKVIDTPYDNLVQWQYRPYPWVAAVSGTNFCHIGLDVDQKRGRIVVFSVLDNLGKGGASAGVQNMNIMFGLDEKIGLTGHGLHPY